MLSQGSRTTYISGIGGRASPWSKVQQDIIEQLIPAWHDFSLVKHKDKEGRDPVLTKWKKNEANKILLKTEFTVLPSGVSSSFELQDILSKLLMIDR